MKVVNSNRLAVSALFVSSSTSIRAPSALSEVIRNNIVQRINKKWVKKIKQNRKLSQDIFDMSVEGATTATIERYFKEPPPREVPFESTTGSGYSANTNGCVLNGAGIYGSSSPNADESMPLIFTYELEIIPSTSDDDIQSLIIPELEQAIGKDLATDVGICTSPLSRNLQEPVVGTMQGVGLLPVDQVDTTRTCSINNDESSCVFVNGNMTLYYIPSNTLDMVRDGMEISEASLEIIESNMNSGKYNSGVNQNIVSVTYIETSEDITSPAANMEAAPANPSTPPVARGTVSQKAYGMVIIASCAVLAVVAIIFVRRKGAINNSSSTSTPQELQSMDKDDNGDNCDQSITKNVPPDLEISVTDTTDVSTMGSPSSADDSSLSTLDISMGDDGQQQNVSTSELYKSVVSGGNGNKRTVPAPLLGGQDEDEKSYQDDELLFTT